MIVCGQLRRHGHVNDEDLYTWICCLLAAEMERSKSPGSQLRACAGKSREKSSRPGGEVEVSNAAAGSRQEELICHNIPVGPTSVADSQAFCDVCNSFNSL